MHSQRALQSAATDSAATQKERVPRRNWKTKSIMMQCIRGNSTPSAKKRGLQHKRVSVAMKKKRVQQGNAKNRSTQTQKSAAHHAATKQRVNATRNIATKTTVLMQQQHKKREHCDATQRDTMLGKRESVMQPPRVNWFLSLRLHAKLFFVNLHP